MVCVVKLLEQVGFRYKLFHLELLIELKSFLVHKVVFMVRMPLAVSFRYLPKRERGRFKRMPQRGMAVMARALRMPAFMARSETRRQQVTPLADRKKFLLGLTL